MAWPGEHWCSVGEASLSLPTEPPPPLSPLSQVDWSTRIRQFLGSQIFRSLTLVVFLVCLYTVGVNQLEHLLFQKQYSFATSFTGFFGLTMSVLLVHRTNGSYSRWWEGRTVWGQLVNDCRNLVVKANSYGTAPFEEREALQRLIASFPPALRDHLRSTRSTEAGVPDDVTHGPTYVAEKIFKKLQLWRSQGWLDEFYFLALDRHAQSMIDICGKCERIQNTPLPLSHRALIPQLLALYLLALPWGLPNHLSAIVLVGVLAYFLVGLELIADGLERPFGLEDDSLHLDTLCQGIASTTAEVIGRNTAPEQGRTH